MISDPPTRALSRIRIGAPITWDDFDSLWHAGYISDYMVVYHQARVLFAADWRPEPPAETCEYIRPWCIPSQWPWRRPPLRPGRPGRRFASTGRAYGTMMREHERGGQQGGQPTT
jgi:hypothetical protein